MLSVFTEQRAVGDTPEGAGAVMSAFSPGSSPGFTLLRERLFVRIRAWLHAGGVGEGAIHVSTQLSTHHPSPICPSAHLPIHS